MKVKFSNANNNVVFSLCQFIHRRLADDAIFESHINQSLMIRHGFDMSLISEVAGSVSHCRCLRWECCHAETVLVLMMIELYCQRLHDLIRYWHCEGFLSFPAFVH